TDGLRDRRGAAQLLRTEPGPPRWGSLDQSISCIRHRGEPTSSVGSVKRAWSVVPKPPPDTALSGSAVPPDIIGPEFSSGDGRVYSASPPGKTDPAHTFHLHGLPGAAATYRLWGPIRPADATGPPTDTYARGIRTATELDRKFDARHAP